jgi:hypothetical protein
LLRIYDHLKAALFEKGGAEMIRQVLERSNAVSLIEYEKEPFNEGGAAALLSRGGGGSVKTAASIEVSTSPKP